MCKSRNEIHIKNEFINQTTMFVIMAKVHCVSKIPWITWAMWQNS